MEFETYRENYENAAGNKFPITFGQDTGQEKEEARQRMRESPPHILLTNYMMLELLLTRIETASMRICKFLVFDELHTYRGRQGADVAMLIRRIQAQCNQKLARGRATVEPPAARLSTFLTSAILSHLAISGRCQTMRHKQRTAT